MKKLREADVQVTFGPNIAEYKLGPEHNRKITKSWSHMRGRKCEDIFTFFFTFGTPPLWSSGQSSWL
jgi:hypothetical protein